MTLNNSQPSASPNNETRTGTTKVKDEIDIIDLIRPLWQHNVLLLTITAIVVALAIVLILLVTPQYKIYTQLKSGTYLWDKNGAPISYMETADLKTLLDSGIFDTYTAKLGFDHPSSIFVQPPSITVTSTHLGNQLIVTTFWPDPVEGKKMLEGYINFLNNRDKNNDSEQTSGLQNQRNSLQISVQTTLGEITINKVKQQTIALDIEQNKEELKLIDMKRDIMKRDIGRINADLKMTKGQMLLLQERIQVTEETRINYNKSRLGIETNTTKIISLRDTLLQTPPNDSLQLLLLANTIQQNIAYLNTIDQKIEATRKEVISCHKELTKLAQKQEENHLSIADLQARIDIEIPKYKSDIEKKITELTWNKDKKIPTKIALLQQKIDELNEKIRTIALVEIIEYPQASLNPVKPNRKKVVAFAGLMGGFIAIICAYGRHFWLINRERLTNDTINN